MLAPGNDMRARDRAEPGRIFHAGEENKLRTVDFICPACFFVGDVATAREIPIERLVPFEAVLQLAVQFAYDFVLHAACPPLQCALVLGIMRTGGAQRYTAGGSIMVPKM